MPTPLSKVKNFEPVTAADFAAMGLKTLEQVVELGWEDTCRRFVLYFPQRWNAEVFIGIICGIAGTSEATDRQRNMANDLVKLMKYELGAD